MLPTCLNTQVTLSLEYSHNRKKKPTLLFIPQLLCCDLIGKMGRSQAARRQRTFLRQYTHIKERK